MFPPLSHRSTRAANQCVYGFPIRQVPNLRSIVSTLPAPSHILDFVSRNAMSSIGEKDVSVSVETLDGVLPKNFTIDESGLLVFDPDSPQKPANWSCRKKFAHTALFGMVTFGAQMNSTTTSAEKFTELLNQEFGISREVALLTSTLYILGIAFGPMVFAPLSEVYGRKFGVLVPTLISSAFTFGVATSYNVPSLMIFRFLSGFCAGAPIVSAGGVLADLYPDTTVRGQYFAFYGQLVNGGSSMGPIVASLMMYSNDSLGAWRIPQYFSGLLSLVLYFFCEFVLDETYTPVLTKKEAKKIRISSGDWKVHCQLDMWQLDLKDVATKHLVRPFAMLITPIVFVIVLFASYVYGVFYIVITTMPAAFTMTRGWKGTIASLPNIALFIGVCFGNISSVLLAGRKNHGNASVPEDRFLPLMYFGWLMPAGIFLFSWTSTANIHWIIPCLGIVAIGYGFIIIFQGCLNYLVDTYTKYAASGIAANTFMRSVFAASFPLFAKQLFENLGVHWGGSLIGFIALGMIPIPFYFYKYGAAIRAKNPYQGI